MAPRGRPKKMVGNTRMDAALDAMRPFGFEEKLIRQTVHELLDVYEGTQGWPFIEEASYKLLIETILGKQISSVDEKDDARRDGVTETSSAATLTNGINEVGSSSLVAEDPVSHACDDLNSASQTNYHHDSPSHGTSETDVKDTNVPTDRGDTRAGSKKEQNPVDNVKGSNDKTFLSNLKSTFLRSSTIESSKTHEKLKDNVKGSNHNKPFLSNVESNITRNSMIESSRKRDKLMNNVKGSNDKAFVRSDENTVVRSSMFESSKARDKLLDNVKAVLSNDKAFESNDENTVVRSSMIESSKTGDKLMDNNKGSNHKTFVSNVESTIVKSSTNESSKKRDKLPGSRRRPYNGWISHDSEVDLIYFPLPPLPEHIEKLVGKGEASQGRRRKSRWDEKPDDM